MSAHLDAYLAELERELRRRGVLKGRIVEEVRGHVLDAVEAGERQGLPPEAALEAAIQRFGLASTLAGDFAAERSETVQSVLLVAGITLGLLFAYVDSRPTWDDNGISAGLVLLTAGLLGALAPRRPWLGALSVGLWIPLIEILNGGNFGSLIALAIAFVGAYAGMLLRRAVVPS